jgi:hypothetical protein
VPLVFEICDVTGRRQLVDQLGRMPYRMPFLHPINVAELGSGTYYVRISNGPATQTWPLVIVR